MDIPAAATPVAPMVNVNTFLQEIQQTPGLYSDEQLLAKIRGVPLPQLPDSDDVPIEADMLPLAQFPVVEWLSYHNMRMFRWEGDAAGWTGFALNIDPFYVDIVQQAAPIISRETGCPMKLSDQEMFEGHDGYLRHPGSRPEGQHQGRLL